jgi:N-carbamoylputrescine amidase
MVFATPCRKLAIYICHDRHVPEGWRSVALNGAQYIVNPSATAKDLSWAMWDVEQRCAALNNCLFIGAIDRVGVEPWGFGSFHGSSLFVDPRGETLVRASEDIDELIVADPIPTVRLSRQVSSTSP